MWDNFWRVVIFVAFAAALTTCASCAMSGDSISDMVENLAENCKRDMESIELDFDEDGKKLDDMRLKCAGYGL